jgi:hypothetical protein
MAAIDPARGPRPNRCRASAASAFGSMAMRQCPCRLRRGATLNGKLDGGTRQGRGSHIAPSWPQDEKLER